MGALLWRLHPNGKTVAGVSITVEDYERIRERGWLSVNGHRADIRAVEAPEPLEDFEGPRVRLRIEFRENFPEPHP